MGLDFVEIANPLTYICGFSVIEFAPHIF